MKRFGVLGSDDAAGMKLEMDLPLGSLRVHGNRRFLRLRGLWYIRERAHAG
jgi:hypothetical protein